MALCCNASFLVDQATAPAFFGTTMVPVDLSTVQRLKIGAIEKHVSLFYRFPFHEAQLSDQHGYMEVYDSFEELQQGGGGWPSPCSSRSFSCQWSIATNGPPRPFHGFGFYVMFGDSRDGPWTSSNSSGPNHSWCSSWCNVFLPVGRGLLACHDGDVIICQTTCHVGKSQPSYDYAVRVVRQGGGGGA